MLLPIDLEYMDVIDGCAGLQFNLERDLFYRTETAK